MTKSRRGVGTASRLALLLAGAAGCSGADRAPGTVIYASGADLQSINSLVTVHSLARQVQKNVLFLTLVAYDSALHPVPRLATPEWSADRRVLTFRLRPDVYWHDGVRTTALDAKWTLEMARTPAVAYPRARELQVVSEVTAPDSLTLVVRFSAPQVVFPDVFTDLAILPGHLLRDVPPAEMRTAPFNRRPTGNGPFQFVEYVAGQRWIFQRRDSFPEALGRANIPRLAVVVVDEPATKLAGLTSGELDFAGIAPAHADIVRQNPVLRVVDYPIMLSTAIFWNLRRELFRDRKVRDALDLAIDRKVIAEGFLHGFGTPAAGPVPPEHPWYDSIAVPLRDSSRASQLLDQAGWARGSDGIRIKGGQRLAFDLLTVGSGDNLLEQMVQAQLKSVGVEMRIRQLELSAFLGVLQGKARDYDAALTGITGDLGLGYVEALFDSRTPGPLAYSGYSSPAFEAAVDRARQASKEADVIRAWKQAQKVLNQDRPVSWLYHARGVQGVNRRVQNVQIDLRGEMAGIARWTLAHEATR